MAEYAYLSLRFREFTIERGLHHLEAALQLFPQSAARPGFRLVVRSLGPEEPSTVERDLIASPADVRALASEFLHEDTAYEVTAHWDLCRPRGTAGWEQGASPVEFLLEGQKYYPGREPADREHLLVNLGPEHLYIGAEEIPTPETRRYLRENNRRLYDFLRALETSLPLTECLLWSEGEQDFARRCEEMLAARNS
ncbi:MAG: hypothetical protein HYY26_05470 [Acidobacteria bacterium]|nr:hypothetical protein [Acidobacteriota bacterium]